MADVQVFSMQPERPRKRRRRTMACTQCRGRKLRCDREYPTCTRCLKSRTPTKCTYEDGFLWQQPATATTAFAADQGSAPLPRPDHTPVHTPPDSGFTAPLTRPDELVSSIVPAVDPVSTVDAPRHKFHHKERGFLETVLGAPKAGVNQEPYVQTDLLQRPKRVATEPEPFASRFNASGEEEPDDLSPTHQLDVAPRMMMRGRETKTRFGGSGIYAHLVAQVRIVYSCTICPTSTILTYLVPRYHNVRRGYQAHESYSFPCSS